MQPFYVLTKTRQEMNHPILISENCMTKRNVNTIET